MERALLLWTMALCASTVVWLIMDIKYTKIDYGIYHFLVDKKTGAFKRPNEIMDMPKILNITQQYISSTNAVERLYDLEYNLNLENPNTMDQAYSNPEQLKLSAWPVANQTKCGQQLSWILNELKQVGDTYPLIRGRKGYELSQLVGSMGKPEGGVFSAGATSWLGSYEHCNRIRVSSVGEEPFRTRYCWLRLRFKWWPKNETVYPPTVIRVGSCLPEACDTQSETIYANQIESLVKFGWPKYYADNLEFESLFCLPDERSPIRQIPLGGYYYLSALGAWLALVLTATLLYEIHRHKRRQTVKGAKESQFIPSKTMLGRQGPLNELENPSDEYWTVQVLGALSIHSSIKRFKTNRFKFNYSRLDRIQRPRVDLSCFDSFKVVMAIIIVLGHGAFLGSSLSRSLVNRVDMNTGIYASLAMSIGRCVDTFFIFFGVLTSYNIMRKFTISQLKNPLIWAGINTGILLRISPIFMLVYWYARLIAPYTASGPWWDYGVIKHSLRGICVNEQWWKSILYFGCHGTPSVSPPISPCIPPAWFIVSYSQISLILPLVTYIIIRLPNRLWRIALMAFLCTISVLQFAIKIANQTTIDGKAFTLYGGFLVDMMEKFESSGQMSTIGRVGCVSIGCYVGYLLRRYELGEIREWPKWLRSGITCLVSSLISLIVILMPIIGHFILRYTQRAGTLTEVVITNSICIILWPILNAILIIYATSIHNHMVYVRFLGHSFWHAFNKLGLCIYLIHWEILIYGLTSYEQGPSYGYVMDVLKLWAYSLIFTIIFAFIIHILVEAPLTELLMILGKSFLQSNSKIVYHEDDQSEKANKIDVMLHQASQPDKRIDAELLSRTNEKSRMRDT